MKALAATLCTVLAATAAPAQERLSIPRADGARVPILEFAPDTADCPPLLILSHGFGGTERALVPYATAAAQAGFRAITLGHAESGRSQLRAVLHSSDRRAALTAAVSDPAVNIARMRDLDAVLAYATRPCRPPFTALAGHSMGAQLTLIEAGATTTLGVTGKNRFDAYIALSPQGEGGRFPPGAWHGIDKPVLMITGTRDGGLEGGWRSRLTPFGGLPPGHKWLAVIDNATHMDLGGRARPGAQRNVTAIMLAFLARMGKPSARQMPPLAGVQYHSK